MNQRQSVWNNHSRALCGEIKSRMLLHLPVSAWCVSGLAERAVTQTLNDWWLTSGRISHVWFVSIMFSQVQGDVRLRGLHMRVKTHIICWADVLKRFIRRVWCLTSRSHNWASPNCEIERVLSHELTATWFCHMGISCAKAKTLSLIVFVWGKTDTHFCRLQDWFVKDT